MKSSIDVVGVGRATGTADAVLLDIRVSCDGTDVARTLDEANRLMSAVHAAATGAGVASADLRTTGAGVGQRWAPDGSGPAGHTAYQTARVRVDDIDAVGSVITACASAAGDAFGLDSLVLHVSDDEPLLAVARERAFADARRKADQYAGLAGRTVGHVVAVSEIASAVGGFEARDMKSRVMAAGADLPVSPGETTVSAQVAVRYAWAD